MALSHCPVSSYAHIRKVGQLTVRIEVQCLLPCLDCAGEISSPYVIRNQMAADLDIERAQF